MTTLETERLVLRAFTEADAEAANAYERDTEWSKQPPPIPSR